MVKNSAIKKHLKIRYIIIPGLIVLFAIWFWPIQIQYDIDQIDYIEFWNGNIGKVVTVSDPDEMEEILSTFEGLYFRRQFKFDNPNNDNSGGFSGTVIMKGGTEGMRLRLSGKKSIGYGFFYYAPYVGEIDESAFYRLYGQEAPDW